MSEANLPQEYGSQATGSGRSAPVESVPVLIVGGGLSGLSTALFLGLHGVRPLLVEKHPGTSVVMKARGQYPHTMEALRIGGVADRIVAASPGGTGEFYMALAETLAGPVLRGIMTQGEMSMSHVSPEGWGMASQERTEVILADRARELGARLAFGTELASFTQDADGVTAVLRDVTTGAERTVRAQQLVAADGRHSPVRAALGVGTHGRGRLGEVFRVFFDADMSASLAHLPGGVAEGRRFALFHLLQPVPGVFYTTDVPGRYGYIRGMTREQPDFTGAGDERCAELVRTGLGMPDLELTVTGSGGTEIVCEVADRFSVGRVHLVGDAAKVVPAPGGLGGNTAVMDGFYLAWKLALTVRGLAGPGLLASHDAERRPVSDMIAEQQFANTVERLGPDLDDGTAAAPIHPVTQVFGYRCARGAVVREPGDDGELLEDPTAPTGRPGSRAPYVPLDSGGSTTALFGRGFVLLAGPDGGAWQPVADAAARRLGVPVAVHRTGGWEKAYGVSSSGAALVRPDRFLAWRAVDDTRAGELEAALRTVLDRPGD
ncbi:FAD-dependent monooxygenase [Streptomyces griseosporeus]|uniref:FAD-dependent monooxygenase n=1 Tax=Streptomyces griseosporeus TaxID=1910 RepID=UPI0036FFE348